jgi:hypothetical protein
MDPTFCFWLAYIKHVLMIEGLVKWYTYVILVINLHILSYLAFKSVVEFLNMTEANNLYTPQIA